MMDADKIAWAAEIACLLEVCAEKPGNVTRYRDYRDMCFEEFVISAAAIGPVFRYAANVPVGETILRALSATRRFVSVNTNLGIILLLAPLAKAAGLGRCCGFRESLHTVLNGLTVADTRMAYEAIRLASPTCLGTVEQDDVREANVDITLGEAMAQARDRDAVAREYSTDFAITFEIGYPALENILKQGAGLSEAIVQTFLTILAQVPDTLIARKNGRQTAENISESATTILQVGGIFSEKGRIRIAELDRVLRDEKNSLNPGTTADLVSAALFVYLVEHDLPHLMPSPLCQHRESTLCEVKLQSGRR